MSIRQRFRAAFVVVLIALVLVAVLDTLTIRARSAALTQARRVSQAQLGGQHLFSALVESDGRLESYLATGEPRYVQGFAAGLDRIRRTRTDLGSLVADRPAEEADLRAVSSGIAAWQVLATDQIAAGQRRRAAAPVRATGPAMVAYQRSYQTAIGALLSLQASTSRTVAAARNRLDATMVRVTRVLYASVLMAAVLIGTLGLLVRRWVLLPLAAIARPVRLVGAGALGTAIPATGPPELARLGADVDAMRRRLLDETDAARRAAAELARAEQQQRLLFDSIRDYSIVRVDRSGVVTGWNTGAELISGRPAADMIGKSIDLVRPADSEHEESTAELLARADRGAMQRQVWRQRPDGSRILVSMVITPIRGPHGDVEGYASVSRDVTAPVAAEQAILRARDELARQAAELRQSNARLADANRELTDTNEELDSFSYTVSHDLRGPLRAIAGFSELLLEEHGRTMDPEAVRLLRRVCDNAGRMGLLIDDLLAFAKLRRAGLSKTMTPLADVAREAWAELESQREHAAAELRVEPLPSVPADPRLLKQVFVNLFSNALKFSAAGGPADPGRVPLVLVTADADPDGSGQPVISVRDNGVGFDARYADRLFQVFQRLHGDDVDGTGIGLSIVHRIITRHGGRIWAGSELGNGATFSFTLGPDTAAPQRLPAQPAAGRAPAEAAGSAAVGGRLTSPP